LVLFGLIKIDTFENVMRCSFASSVFLDVISTMIQLDLQFLAFWYLHSTHE
jgi:hypothetical protein